MSTYDKRQCLIRKDEKEDDLYLYNYELTMRKGNETATFRIPLYSITVKLTDVYGNESQNSLTDAFSDAAKALKFYEKIVDHLVTPIDLAYIIEDEAFI